MGTPPHVQTSKGTPKAAPPPPQSWGLWGLPRNGKGQVTFMIGGTPNSAPWSPTKNEEHWKRWGAQV